MLLAVDEISERIRRFIYLHIDSIEQLRVLLLLFRNPQRQWPLHEITLEICSVDSAIEKRLRDLYERQVLRQDQNNTELHVFLPFSPLVSEIKITCLYHIQKLILLTV